MSHEESIDITRASQIQRITLGLLVGCSLLVGINSVDAAERRELGTNSRNQIEALIAEKAARSPSQRKLDSQLIYALRQKRQQPIAPGLDRLESAVRPRPDGQVLVDLRARIEPELLARIEAGGGTVVNQHPRFQAIRAWVPLELVEALAARPEVRNIRPADEARTNVGITSQGDVTHQAMVARNTLVVDGAGVKVGVLSDSVDYLANSQTNGELPFVTVLPGRAGFGTGEGTAILEIVHDLAPGSQLYFSTAFQGVAAFAQSILDLHAAGCRVIVDDVIYFVESPFQDGPISQAVNEVSAAGTLYFSSAGNSGNLNDRTSSTWEGDFRDGGPATVGRGGRVHDFGAGALNAVSYAFSPRVDLFWTDPLGQSTNDYDVYLVDASGSVVGSSSNIQDGDDDPYESIGVAYGGTSIVIVKYSGADRYLYLSGGRAPLAFNTSGATRGHNASGASNAFSVAATWVRSPALPFTGGSVNPVETFNSDGPRRMFFQPDGTPITPGNFSATGGLLLQKPDITAADGVATSVPGFATFFGTSAAAPHAAAIAALLLSYNPSLTPSEVRLAMESTALDIEALGVDRDSGAGIVMALAALQAPATPLPRLVLDSTILNGGNGNGTVDADECGDVFVTLRNLIAPGGETATGVVGELRSLTPGVVVHPSPRAFSDIPPAGTGINQLPFRISTTPEYSCTTPASFSLHVTTENAHEFNLNFLLASSPPTTGGALTFVSTDVPRPIPDLGLIESAILVSNLSRQIEKVRVALYVTHSFDSDLVISLIGPDGTTAELTSHNGGSGANYGTSCAGLTIFDDAASLSITAGAPPFSGAFRPEQPLAAFIGKLPAAANGEWKLRILDQAGEDTGILQCWTLEATPISCPRGTGACLVAPSITAQPVDVFATNGSTLGFTVVAQGTEPLYYQWFFNTTNLLTEATNASLTLPDVTLNQAGAYSVIVSNFYGTATSAPAQLTLVAPPQIVQPPQDTLATNGTSVQLTVTATGTAPLAYQWFFNTTNLLTHSTNPVLTLAAVTPSMAGSYSVLVSNPYGSALSPEAALQIAVLPYITQQPQSLILKEGSTAVFTVGAGGSEPLSYYWYFNETNLLAGTVGPALVLTGVTLSDAGGYSVIVSNAYGVVATVEAELRVSNGNLPPEVVLIQPTGGAVFTLDSGPILLDATATDPDGSIVKVGFFADGALLGADFTAPYQFEWLDARVGPHQLAAVAWDTEGAASTSTVVRITVNITTNSAKLVSAGAVWKYLDTGVDQGTGWRTLGFDDSTWARGPAQLGYGDGDEATVLGFGPSETNRFPTTYFRRAFVLTDAVSFTNAVIRLLRDDGAVVYLNEVEIFRSNMPTGAITFATLAGSTVSGTAESSFLSNAIDARLFRNGTNLLAVEVHQINATSSDISFDLELQAERRFMPVIVQQPASLSISRGATATFSVGAFGTLPLSYQWYFNETNQVPNATNAVLVIANTDPSAAGNYLVTVSNAFGTVTSKAAVLLVSETNRAPVVVLSNPPGNAMFLADAAPIVLEASASDPDGALGHVAFFANGISLGVATAPPYRAAWLDAPLGTHSLQAIATDSQGASSTSEVVRITVKFSTNIPRLVSTGAVWKYLDTGVDQGVAWRGGDFNDSAWPSGPAELGYGDAADGRPEATIIGFGPNPNNKYPTAYFRRAFVLTDAASFTNTAVRLLRDDGAVVYLNGLELFRSNMPTGSIAFTTRAAGNVNAAGETNYFPSAVDSRLLRNGTNVIAVEVHQFNATSADLSFDLELLAEREHAPFFVTQPVSVVVTNGGTAEFSVVAEGTTPLRYQWYRNQTNLLSGATNAVLTVQPATVLQAGTYSVEVFNTRGRVRSQDALLVISGGGNLPPIVEWALPTNGARFAAGGPISLRAAAIDLDGSVASVSFYADGALLSEDFDSPYQFDWLGASIGLHVVWAVAIDGEGTATVSSIANLSVNSPPGETTSLVSTGAVWKYLDDGTDQGTAWQAPDFDDSSWASGPAELGYGDSTEGRPEATVISFGNNSQLKHITYYFRRAFVVSAPNALHQLRLDVLRDDGAVAYLNGIEVFRSNLPEGNINYLTTAASVVSSIEETRFFYTNVSSSLLLEGTNTLAVEIHQVNRSSTDVSFDLALVSIRADPPRITTHPQNQTATNGDSAEFNVVASGVEPLFFQWFFNTTNRLADATNATLLLSNVTPDRAGSYVVEVRDATGTTYSDPAILVVFSPPPNFPPTVTLISPVDGSTFPEQSAIPLSAAAEDPGGFVAKVEFFADGLSIGVALTSPYGFDWIGAPLGGHILRAVATDNQGATNSSAPVMISILPRQPSPTHLITLISTGSVWKYLDTGIDQGGTWTSPGFDDSAWSSGHAELGYGDAAEGRPEATVLGFGPDANEKFPTYYFRRAFALTNSSAVTELILRVVRDDGVIVYLNGAEVFRDNLPGGSITFTNLALKSIANEEESKVLEATIPVGFLTEGTNIVAVEIHQVNGTSSDISFDLELVATQTDAPVIIVQPSDQTLTLGQTAQFAVTANGTAPLAYQWFRNSLIAIAGATNDTLIILNAQLADEGSYSVVVTNVAGTTRSGSANLRILAAPVIETQPQNVTVVAGGSAVFSVMAAGAEPLHYRWFYNTNTELPGANGHILDLPIVELADAGAYSVTVSNAVGSVSSQPAMLRVLVASQIVQIRRTNGVVVLTFTTVPGLRYTVDFKSDLNLPDWSLLPGAVKLPGTGSPLTVQDADTLNHARFYRIRIE